MVSKTTFFNVASQKIWPFMRFFVQKSLSNRCKKCINSENYQPLNNGICQDCIDFSHPTPNVKNQSNAQSELDALNETINAFCNKSNRGIDALVLFSGGKDSTLLIHKLIQDFPTLRLIALTVDNGVMSPIALSNIKTIIDRIGFSHLFYKPNDNVFQRAFKFSFENVKGQGCSHVVDRIDGDLLHDIGLHIAAKMDIPLVLSGVSKEQVEDIISINQFKLPSSRLESKREKSGILSLSDLAKKSDYDNYWWSPENYTRLPTVVYPNFVWNYSEDDIIRVLEKQCGLGPSRLDPVVTNNLLIPIMGVVDIRQIGYSSYEKEFSKMVRQGKVNRQNWLNTFQFLEYVSKCTPLFDKDMKIVFKQLNVDEKEVFY